MNPFRARSERRRPPFAAVGDHLAGLMVEAGRGDQEAFGRLYDELAPMVHGTSLRVVRDPARAEEVTQEVFVEVWRLAPRYDPTRGSVRAWVATIAHRRAVDCIRSTQASRERDAREAAQAPASEPGVDQEVEAGADHQRVQRALSRLTALQRQSVELAYYGGHTYREVAELLGVPEGTVKTRIRDGLIRLRDELGADP